MKRWLSIEFLENCNVKYSFYRHPDFKEYTIDFQSEMVEINNENELKIWGYEKSITNNGNIKYARGSDEVINSMIVYTKLNFLKKLQSDTPYYEYHEKIKIKHNPQHYPTDSCFVINIHDRNRRMSAVKNKSKAIFFAQSDGYFHSCHAFYRHSHKDNGWHTVCSEHKIKSGEKINLLPTELANAQFYCQGILTVDWLIEIDESRSK